MVKPSILIISSHADLGGAPTVALSIAHLLSSHFKFTFLVGSSGSSLDWIKLNSYNYRIFRFLRTSFSSFLFIPFSTLYVFLFALRSRTVLLHCHSFVASISGRIASVFLFQPFVYTVHGWPWRGQPLHTKFFLLFLEFIVTIFTFFKNSSVVYVSNSVAKEDPFKMLRRRKVVIYNASKIDSLGFCQAGYNHSKILHSDHSIQLLMLSRFSTCKGFNVLFKALSFIPSTYSFNLKIVGENTDSNACKSLALSLASHQFNSICFYGPCSDPSQLLSISDLLILPSFYEALPLCILDAMYLAKPVLASSVGGIPEMVHNGVNGFLVQPSSPKVLAIKLMEILTNPDLLTHFGSNAKSIYSLKFNSTMFSSSYKDIYFSLLG